MRHKKEIAEAALLLLGLVLFVQVIADAGVDELLSLLKKLTEGWSWAVFLIYPFMSIWDVWAWQHTFDSQWRTRIPFRRLYPIRLTGEALNNVTPIIDIGGEPLKILWLEKILKIPHDAGLKSVVVDRTALFLSEIVFVMSGLFLFARTFPIPAHWQSSLTLGAAISGLSAVVLLIVVKSFRRFEIRRKAFAKAFLLHLAGWLAGGIEMFFIFSILGNPIPLSHAMVIESLLQLVRLSSFFIPSNLGAQESGMVFLAGTLGMAPAFGIAVSLLKRTRQLIWTAIGFALWGLFKASQRRRDLA